jgi:hypothetical protein
MIRACRRLPACAAVGCGHIADTVNTLEAVLKNSPYLCGDHFTTADLLAGSYIGWEMMQKNLEERPVFKEYVQRLDARPAARRAAYERALRAIDPSEFRPFSPAGWTQAGFDALDNCIEWPDDPTAGSPLAPGTPLPAPKPVFPRYVEPEDKGQGA